MACPDQDRNSATIAATVCLAQSPRRSRDVGSTTELLSCAAAPRAGSAAQRAGAQRRSARAIAFPASGDGFVASRARDDDRPQRTTGDRAARAAADLVDAGRSLPVVAHAADLRADRDVASERTPAQTTMARVVIYPERRHLRVGARHGPAPSLPATTSLGRLRAQHPGTQHFEIRRALRRSVPERLDLVADAHFAVERRHTIEGRDALGLVLHIAGQGHPSVPHADVN